MEHWAPVSNKTGTTLEPAGVLKDTLIMGFAIQEGSEISSHLLSPTILIFLEDSKDKDICRHIEVICLWDLQLTQLKAKLE